ncbi:MAG: tripartite tricarboxylate transporter TctB family protein [Armatimonadota bacterium]|nr:tripartite tricarboxylate transporter TctB family protein [Armatimonadota bacterium]
MHRAGQAMALALVASAILLLREAVRLPVAWTPTGPGAGFFPTVLAIGLAFNAILILLKSLQAAPGGDRPFLPPGAWKPLVAAFLPMVAVVALIDYLGLYLGGALYLAGYTLFVGRHRPVTIVLVSVLIPLGLFLIFERWFLLLLPKGVILEYLLYRR